MEESLPGTRLLATRQPARVEATGKVKGSKLVPQYPATGQSSRMHLLLRSLTGSIRWKVEGILKERVLQMWVAGISHIPVFSAEEPGQEPG